MIDLTYLRITTSNDKTVIKELIQLFLSQLPDLKEAIEKSFKEKNWFALKEAAHKAKNSFEIIGEKQQAENLKKIEILAIEEKENPEINKLVNSFLKSCKLVVKELEQLKI